MRINSARRISGIVSLLVLLLGVTSIIATAQNLQAARTITMLSGSETSAGSVVTITADAALADYASYRSEDRFFMVIRSADVARIESGLNGCGFDDTTVQRRGNDVVISFRLQPNVTARVIQRFNKLEVLFSSKGEAVSYAA